MPPCPTQSSCRWQCHCNANIGIETFFSTEATTTESLYPLPLAFFHLIRASKVELRLWARPLAWKAKFSPALFSTHPWDGEIALSFIQPFWQKEVCFPTITTILSVQLAGLAMHTTVQHLFEIKDCIGEEEPIIDGSFREMTIWIASFYLWS